jgi:hypothetical protein
MAFARWLFRIAGAYGIFAIVPLYFAVDKYAPVLGTPAKRSSFVFFYGFLGIALAWQVVFLIIGHDPKRFRPLMLPAVIEKLGFFVPTTILYRLGMAREDLFAAGVIDGILGVMFLVAWYRLRSGPSAAAPI